MEQPDVEVSTPANMTLRLATSQDWLTDYIVVMFGIAN